MNNIDKWRDLEAQRSALYEQMYPIREKWLTAANKVLVAEDRHYKSDWAIPTDAKITLVDGHITVEWEVWSQGGFDTLEQTFPVALLEDDAAIEKLVEQRKQEREAKAASEAEASKQATEARERAELAQLQEKYGKAQK